VVERVRVRVHEGDELGNHYDRVWQSDEIECGSRSGVRNSRDVLAFLSIGSRLLPTDYYHSVYMSRCTKSWSEHPMRSMSTSCDPPRKKHAR
jgi:hypothetical protein